MGKSLNWISRNENCNVWDTKYTKYDHNRLETAEKKMNKLEDKAIKTIQNSHQM